MISAFWRALALTLLPLLLCSSARPQTGGTVNKRTSASTQLPSFAEGTLKSVENARVRKDNGRLMLERIDPATAVTLHFGRCQGTGIHREAGQWWLLPTGLAPAPVHANTAFWVLPLQPDSSEASWHVEFDGADATAVQNGGGLTFSVPAPSLVLSRAEARPHSDPFGHRFTLAIEGGKAFEDALAGFYWGTVIPSVVEKTMAAHFPYSSGYVLSTLNVQSYAGSYPAVDHEFQIKGRLAMGSDADLDIVRRMIELQFRLMNDDPEHLSRSPTSVQPDGRREYHIRRDSKDGHENAAMFPFTANIEVVEESWLFYNARKDTAWLQQNIANLEDAAAWTAQSIDQYGRLWSDVYYEDQVIKDGRETEAQAFAAHSFELLARMEATLQRKDKTAEYRELSRRLAAALIAPLPVGYWDSGRHRFVDWVDRNSKVHDHTHLLANTLPLTFGYATEEQARGVLELVQTNAQEFERFPSFVAADIAAYSDSEQGTAGAYDLSAAGRYWFWDAAFRQSEGQSETLFEQLKAVAAEGKRSAYFMGERYDMDHVYYIDGKPSHGAEKYYEYPNVFAAVLLNDYLGVVAADSADVSISPQLRGAGTVALHMPRYQLRYTVRANGFDLENLSDKERTFDVDLSRTDTSASGYVMTAGTAKRQVEKRTQVVLKAHEIATWEVLK